MPVSLSEAAQTLLSGNVLSWAKFGEYKAGSVQLASPGARRLLHYLMSCDRTKVADAREDLFAGLVAAWQNTAIDPATTTKPIRETAHTGTWRLVRLESAGFGGLNLVDGPNLVLALNGENWCLEGQNGSGKTSLASAIIWALTGCRCRDQDGVVVDDGRRTPVFNDSGVQIGDWPPLVAYPATPSKLSGKAETWVRLTFQNENGDKAEAYRRLLAPTSGEPVSEEKIDPALLSAPQLIETGLLMPARLSRIGFGERSQSIYEAVKLLTGLDQLADIGEGAANFSHKAKRFLKYGLDSGIQAIETKMELSLKRAEEEAAKAAFELKISAKREDKDFAKELRDIAERATAQAGTLLSILASDIASGLDKNKSDDRTKIKNAVSAARGILQQGVKGITAFDAWAALRAAHTDAAFQKLPRHPCRDEDKAPRGHRMGQASSRRRQTKTQGPGFPVFCCIRPRPRRCRMSTVREQANGRQAPGARRRTGRVQKGLSGGGAKAHGCVRGAGERHPRFHTTRNSSTFRPARPHAA
jgi:hypothetical protein